MLRGEPCWFTFDNRRLYCLQADLGLRWFNVAVSTVSNLLEAIASRLEAIASRLEAFASRVEAILIGLMYFGGCGY